MRASAPGSVVKLKRAAFRALSGSPDPLGAAAELAVCSTTRPAIAAPELRDDLLTLRSKFPPQSDRQADDCSACLSNNQHEALEGDVASALQIGNLTRLASFVAKLVERSSRNSGAAIAGRVVLHTASSAAALGHLAPVHKRGSGAKTARSRSVVPGGGGSSLRTRQPY
jgi:hypothetical protein